MRVVLVGGVREEGHGLWDGGVVIGVGKVGD